VGDCPESKTADQSNYVIVFAHRRMTVITHDPDVSILPRSALLGVVSNRSDCVIDDRVRLLDVRACVSFGMRCLVDSSARCKNE
jgi:hypothetical protein